MSLVAEKRGRGGILDWCTNTRTPGLTSDQHMVVPLFQGPENKIIHSEWREKYIVYYLQPVPCRFQSSYVSRVCLVGPLFFSLSRFWHVMTSSGRTIAVPWVSRSLREWVVISKSIHGTKEVCSFLIFDRTRFKMERPRKKKRGSIN